MVSFGDIHKVFNNNTKFKKRDKIQHNCYIFRIRSLIKIKDVFFSHTLMPQTDMPQRLAHIKGFKEQIRICVKFKLLYKYIVSCEKDLLHIENVTQHFPSPRSLV